MTRPAFAALVTLLVSISLATVRAQSDSDVETSVAVLVDISKSFAPLTPADRTALEQLGTAVTRAATTAWEPPVSIYWAAIGTSGLLANSSLCGTALFHPRLVSGAGRKEISSAAQLQLWLRECITAAAARGQKPEDYTDVSGSVAVAAENGRRINGRKVIAILSDFVEDHPAGVRPTDFKLSGEVVVMLYRAQAADAANPNQLFARLKDWEDRFTRAGARSACRVNVIGVTSGKIASCF